MPFVYGAEGTFTFDATGGIDGYCSTYLNGTVCEVYVVSSVAASTDASVKIVGESTGKVVLHITDPSTLGAYYYPTCATISTGAVTASTFGLATPVLHKERPRVIASGTSGMDSTGTIAVKVYVD